MGKIFCADQTKYIVAIILGKPQLRTLPCPKFSDGVLHSEIANQIQEGFEDIRGGGRIYVNHKQKQIEVYGLSGFFGPAFTDEVKKLVKEAMEKEGLSHYELSIKDTIDENE